MFKNKIVRGIVIVLAIILVIVAAIVVWQYENITAFIDGVNLDEQQINQKVEQAHKEISDTMTKDNLQPPRAPTKEEEDALNSNEITQKEFTEILTNQTTLEQIREDKKASEQQDSGEKDENEQKPAEQKPSEQKPSEQKPTEQKPNTQKPVEQKPTEQKPNTQKPTEQKPNTQKPTEQKPTEQKPAEQKPAEQQPSVQKDYETLISEKVAELYAIKANYYAEFNSYWAAARAEFLARPVEEHTDANLAAVVRSSMSQGFAMEDRYDAQVDQVVAELTDLLKAAGRDTSLATAVKNAYVSEKKAEKARIIAKYFG